MTKYSRLQQVQEAIHAGQESCEGAVRYYLSRIEATKHLNAYVEVYTEEALERAQYLWNRINLVNLRQNILPTRPRADLILRKGANHLVEKVMLRKL